MLLVLLVSTVWTWRMDGIPGRSQRGMEKVARMDARVALLEWKWGWQMCDIFISLLLRHSWCNASYVTRRRRMLHPKLGVEWNKDSAETRNWELGVPYFKMKLRVSETGEKCDPLRGAEHKYENSIRKQTRIVGRRRLKEKKAASHRISSESHTCKWSVYSATQSINII